MRKHLIVSLMLLENSGKVKGDCRAVVVLIFLLLCVCTEFPSGAYRHADDGLHGGDGECGEGDVLHQQVLLS